MLSNIEIIYLIIALSLLIIIILSVRLRMNGNMQKLLKESIQAKEDYIKSCEDYISTMERLSEIIGEQQTKQNETIAKKSFVYGVEYSRNDKKLHKWESIYSEIKNSYN